MRIDAAQLDRVLRTFRGQDFEAAAAVAGRLAQMEGTSISRGDSPVPTSELRAIYARRALNPRLRPALARQCSELARIAGLFPSERWYIHIVAIAGRPQVTIFATDEGVGRVCLDYTVP
jgi:hypothetical protein